MNRTLGQTEHVMWLVDQVVPLNAVVSATITGSLNVEQLTEVLAKVQRRHPLLAVKINIDERAQPQFISDKVPSIPLQVIERKDENVWCQVAEEELVHSFSWSQGPLIRAVLINSPKVSELMFTFHHSIGDGSSVVYLLEEILQQLADPSMELEPLPMHPCYEELIPRRSHDTSINEDSLVEDFESYKVADFGFFARLDEQSPKNWQVGLLHWELSSQETATLISCCREEQTSVHGAICASFLSSIADEAIDEGEAILKCFSPVNLRKHLKPPVEKNFGLHTALVLTCHTTKSLTNFWETARKTKHQINQAVIKGKIFDNVPGIEKFLSTKPEPVKVRQYLRKYVASDLFVSNLGQVNLSSQFGSLKLQRLYLTGPGLTVEPFFVGVTTLEGRMCVTFRYVKSAITQVCADRIGQKAMQRLRKASA